MKRLRPYSPIAAVLFWLLGGAVAWGQSASLVLEIKATYLYKFAPFVDWPAWVWPSPATPFSICVAGQDPFGDVLAEAVVGQRLGTHPMVVRQLATVTANAGCDILYAGGSPAQPVAAELAAVAGAPVLTVTDAAPAGPKGIVNFVIRDNRVRFEIDESAAKNAGLAISSKLLQLAVR